MSIFVSIGMKMIFLVMFYVHNVTQISHYHSLLILLYYITRPTEDVAEEEEDQFPDTLLPPLSPLEDETSSLDLGSLSLHQVSSDFFRLFLFFQCFFFSIFFFTDFFFFFRGDRIFLFFSCFFLFRERIFIVSPLEDDTSSLDLGSLSLHQVSSDFFRFLIFFLCFQYFFF